MAEVAIAYVSSSSKLGGSTSAAYLLPLRANTKKIRHYVIKATQVFFFNATLSGKSKIFS